MILLTAFKGNRNASKILVDGIKGAGIYKKLLTNSFASCEKEITEAITEYKPDYIISFGQKPDADRIYIETAARRNGAAINTDFDITVLTGSLDFSDIPFGLSGNAGNYLCNHAYYAGLHCIKQNKLRAKMIFIHVPDMKRFYNFKQVSEWLEMSLRDLDSGLNNAKGSKIRIGG